MAFPRFEAVIPFKAPSPPGAGAFGMASAEQTWLRVLLALAVTVLLSVLPFKAPSVTPFVLQSLASAPTLQDSAPVLRDAVKLAHQALSPTHPSLKVAKKSNRKLWSANLDLASGGQAAAMRELPFERRRLDRRDALLSRSPPRIRLRDPPLLG